MAFIWVVIVWCCNHRFSGVMLKTARTATRRDDEADDEAQHRPDRRPEVVEVGGGAIEPERQQTEAEGGEDPDRQAGGEGLGPPVERSGTGRHLGGDEQHAARRERRRRTGPTPGRSPAPASR